MVGSYVRVRWTRSEDFYTESIDGRFRIEPQYNHSTRPQGYILVDTWHRGEQAVSTQAEGRRLAAKLAQLTYDEAEAWWVERRTNRRRFLGL